MALQVWLPLNGNTKNQGLANVTTSASGLTTVDGKLGSGYRFDNGSQSGAGISINSNLIDISGPKNSIAVWVKPYGNHVHYNGTILSSGNWNGSCWAFGVSQDNTQVDLFGNYYNTYINCSVPVNTWTHLVCVNDGSTAYLYKNGEYVGSGAASSISNSDATNTYVGRETYAGGYFGFNGAIQDLRVYDHCLSPKEIKEISKGLVLHYKMDDKIATNLVKNHQYNIYDNYGVSSSLTKLSETFQGCDVYRLTMTPTSSSVDSFKVDLWSHGIYGFSNVTFKANTKYCFWIYYRPVSHQDVRVGGTASNISGWYEIPPAEYGNGWKVVGQYRNGSVTSDKVDNIFTSFYSPSAVAGTPITIDFCCPHLIEGCSEIIDDGDYQEVDPHTTVYDCSGFGNNGTMTSTTAPISDSNNSRYNSCFNFNTNAKYITTSIDPTGYKDTYSIAWWGNIPSFGGAMFWGFNNMMNWYDGKYWNQGDGGNNPFYSSGTTTITPPSINTWHHYVITGDGSVTKLYVDGVLYGTAKTYRAIGGTSLQINGWPNDANYRIPGMKMSDFRIYATPLSAEDVKELYNTSTVICDNGTVMAYSLEE